MVSNYCDDETMAVMRGLPFLPPSEQVKMAAYAKERKWAFLSGKCMVPDYWQRALANFDPTLAMRFDFDYGCFMVERWLEEEQYWHPILLWRDEYGLPIALSETYIPRLLSILDAANTQKHYGSGREYLLAKQREADANKERHAKARTEAMLEAVDSLSSKSIQQFIDVHRAIHSGDKIVAHGNDEKFLELAKANTERVEAEGGQVVPISRELNPGMHPLIYRRNPR